MLVTSYRSTTHEDKFLFVPYGTKVEKISFPKNVDEDFLELDYHRSFEIYEHEKRVGMDCKDVLRQIEKKGYATQLSKLSFVERIFV